MNLRIFIFIILYVFFRCAFVCAQQPLDTVHVLKEVSVISVKHSHFSTGMKTESVDSNLMKIYSSAHLAQLLSLTSAVYMKSYGPYGLASPGLRGTGAAHTTVLWNGFNIANPLNGSQDLSLIPISLLNSIQLQSGGSSALWGSGAIGGNILLNNTSTMEKAVNAGYTYQQGSFGEKQQSAYVGGGNGKWMSTLKVFQHEAENNFEFTNIAQYGKPVQKLTNAALKQKGVMQENYFKISPFQKINLRAWYQLNNRNIAPSMTMDKSEAHQQDEAIRISSEWQYKRARWEYAIRGAYFNEKLLYTDPAIGLSSSSKTNTYIQEAESHFKWNTRHAVNFGVNNTFYQAYGKNYAKQPVQNRTALFFSYKITNPSLTWRACASGRQEFVSNGLRPFTGSLGFEGNILKNITWRGSLSRNYRLPTFNDLFWINGGNAALLPETSWNEESGLRADFFTNKKLKLNADVSAFNSRINNWIIWLPDNTGKWTPRNVLSVWSRGVEYSLKLYSQLGKIKITVFANYQYTLSSNEKTNPGGESSLQKQLIYVPMKKSQSFASIEYKGIQLAFNYSYVGYRYTSSDNIHFLKPYHTGNLDISKTINIKSISLRLYAQCSNIWNEQYQVIAYYAMPGRCYQAGLSIGYKKVINNNK